MGTLMYCQGSGKLLQQFWKPIWQYLVKLSICVYPMIQQSTPENTQEKPLHRSKIGLIRTFIIYTEGSVNIVDPYHTLCCNYKQSTGLPWWLSGKESACQCRGHGFDPWPRKIPHAAEQLSPCTTTTEPVVYSQEATTTEPTCPNYQACAPQSPLSTTEASSLRSSCTTTREQPPLAATREKPAQQRRPSTPPKINDFFKSNQLHINTATWIDL